MAWLLRNRKRKDDDAGMGQMASTEVPDVHLEAMEEAENKGERAPQVGSTLGKSIPCVQEGLSKQVLAQAGLVSALDLYEHLHLCD